MVYRQNESRIVKTCVIPAVADIAEIDEWL